MVASEDKLLQILHVVIDHYITKGEPIGSKFLATLEGSEMDYAPSTLRKYLKQLEESGLVYQPYNSSGRIPTVEGLSTYLDTFLAELTQDDDEQSEGFQFSFDVQMARSSLRGITDNLGQMVDGVVVAFLSNDEEYMFLGINKLLTDQMSQEVDTTRYIVDFIEQRRVVEFLSQKIMKRGSVYYSFAQDEDKVLSCVYTKIVVNGYDAVVAVIGPPRINYKKNLTVLKKLSSLLV